MSIVLSGVVGRGELADTGERAGPGQEPGRVSRVFSQRLIRTDRGQSVATLQQTGVPAGGQTRSRPGSRLAARSFRLEHPALPMTLWAHRRVAA